MLWQEPCLYPYPHLVQVYWYSLLNPEFDGNPDSQMVLDTPVCNPSNRTPGGGTGVGTAKMKEYLNQTDGTEFVSVDFGMMQTHFSHVCSGMTVVTSGAYRMSTSSCSDPASHTDNNFRD